MPTCTLGGDGGGSAGDLAGAGGTSAAGGGSLVVVTAAGRAGSFGSGGSIGTKTVRFERAGTSLRLPQGWRPGAVAVNSCSPGSTGTATPRRSRGTIVSPWRTSRSGMSAPGSSRISTRLTTGSSETIPRRALRSAAVSRRRFARSSASLYCRSAVAVFFRPALHRARPRSARGVAAIVRLSSNLAQASAKRFFASSLSPAAVSCAAFGRRGAADEGAEESSAPIASAAVHTT